MTRFISVLKYVNRAVSKLEAHVEAETIRSRPVVVDIVLTKACNLACTFCRDYETKGPKHVSESNLEIAARQLFPAATRINICSGGEPYLHAGLEKILRLARHYKLYTYVLSNATLLNEERIRRILSEQLISLHGFSVDGNEAHTVEKIRVNADFGLLVRNIERFIELRNEISGPSPEVLIRYALMRSNLGELPAAIARWGQMGVDRITCTYLGVTNGIDRNESLYYHQELMQSVFVEARSIAAKYPRLTLDLPPSIEAEKVKQANPVPCMAPWRFVMIDPDGAVLPCYRAFEGIQMGNLYGSTSFGTIWNNDSYRALRKTVNRPGDKFFNYCSRCEVRFGWGDLRPHMAGETWIASLREQKGDLVNIDHRRTKTGAAGSGQAE